MTIVIKPGAGHEKGKGCRLNLTKSSPEFAYQFTRAGMAYEEARRQDRRTMWWAALLAVAHSYVEQARRWRLVGERDKAALLLHVAADYRRTAIRERESRS